VAILPHNIEINMADYSMQKLESLARRIRYDIIMSTYAAKSGHPGGSLSITELMAVLYGKVLYHKPKNPNWPLRDRLILSKGHACPALYSALAETGYFPREILWTFRKLDSPLQGHPHKLKAPAGIEVSTGSLGQGLSIAVGLALGARLTDQNWRTYCICGDGEMDEGQVWEALMAGAHHKLNNLCLIVDNNNLQIDGEISEVMELKSLDEKIRAFGWNVLRTDGHHIGSLIEVFKMAESCNEKPTAIIISTVKGRGVSFMENRAKWHGRAPNEEQARKAIEEIGFEWNEFGGAE